jgi:hypothetical protein
MMQLVQIWYTRESPEIAIEERFGELVSIPIILIQERCLAISRKRVFYILLNKEIEDDVNHQGLSG